MPKDEDILQLVSPALHSEVENPGAWGQDVAFPLGLPPVSAPLGGREESWGGGRQGRKDMLTFQKFNMILHPPTL